MKLFRLTLALILLIAGCSTTTQKPVVITLPPAPGITNAPPNPLAAIMPQGFTPRVLPEQPTPATPTFSIMSRAEPASIIQGPPGFVFLPCNVGVEWNPSVPNTNTDDTVATHYAIYYGDCPRHYQVQILLGNVTNSVVTNLTATATYYFAVTALDDAGHESDFSDELRYTVPPNFAELRLEPPGDALVSSPDLFTWNNRDGTLSNGVWRIKVSSAPMEFYRSITFSTQTNMP